MKKNIDVTIIILTYNPIFEKLKNTIQFAVRQQNVDLEILVCDDGSQNDFFDECVQVFKENNFDNYILHKNVKNVGTVKNCISGIECSNGRYVFFTSPGDYLYDENVICDFYRFAQENDSKISFGNAVYYCEEMGQYKLVKSLNIPYRPNLFAHRKSKTDSEIAFYFQGRILGATIFREKTTALKYLKKIQEYSVYVEDSTSSAASLADGISIDYYDRKMIWYEYGTGISTQDLNSEWSKKTNRDYTETIIALSKENPKDAVIKTAVMVTEYKNKWIRRILRILLHPVISLKVIKDKFNPVRYTSDTAEENERLLNYIDNKSIRS